MTSPDLQIIDYLRRDWESGFRITTIDQVLRALGLPRDDELRWRVGRALTDEWHKWMSWRKIFGGLRWLKGFRWLRSLFRLVRLPSLLAEVKEWNPASYILTNNEKLVARYILRERVEAGNLPAEEKIAAALELNEHELRAALQMLARLGFITMRDGTYYLADDHARFLQGLGFSFHTVTLENGEVFNVPWAVDFMLLVSSRYSDQKVVIDDACAHCAERIRIVLDHGELVDVNPPEVFVFEGGTWGRNNLFRSEEHCQEWLKEHPESARGKRMPLQEFYQQL